MKKAYELAIPTKEEARAIDDALIAYNESQVPFTQEEAFIRINRCARAEDGTLLGGILAYSVCWKILYVDVLWVSEAMRGQGLGAALLAAVEEAGREMGCHLAHLSTFDFQGRDFYLKQGYQLFGTLADSPEGHAEYFLSKRL